MRTLEIGTMKLVELVREGRTGPEPMSTNIRAVGYDASFGVLTVLFWNGGIYQYQNVPAHWFVEMIMPGSDYGGSTGRYFQRRIRAGGFEYRRVQSLEGLVPVSDVHVTNLLAAATTEGRDQE